MHNIRIVIVEDELIAAEFLKKIVEREGAKVLTIVDSGKEAIRTCVELKPDVVLMDIMLRDNVSGSEAAVIINQKIDTKIIFLSAYMDDEMVEYAVEANAVGYLTKPYNEKQITTTLRLAIGQQKEKPKRDEPQHNEIHLKGGFVYLQEEKRLHKEGKEVELGPKALKLVSLLASQPNISISNEQIALAIWGYSVNDKTLRSLVFRVRAMTDEMLIKNVSGTGYMIQKG